MIGRCHNPSNSGFAQYGGRGTTVCDRWRNDFWAFVDDVFEDFEEGLSLDRKDGLKGYEPGNCKWATSVEQAANRSSTATIDLDGKIITLMDAARRYGLPPSKVRGRLRAGETVRQALDIDPIKRGRVGNITVLGEVMTFPDACRRYRISSGTVRHRLKRGWTVGEALGIEKRDVKVES